MPNVGISNKGIMRLDGTAPAKSLEMFENYYAPIMHVLNIRQTPWVGLCGDPKYVPSIARDILNEPKVVMSQTEGKFKTKRIAAYDDSLNRIDVEEDHRYAAIETIFMLNEKKVDWRDVDKDILFTIGLNGGQSRDGFIKDWFLDKGRTDVKVYGKWAEEFTTQYPHMFEEKRIAERTVEDELEEQLTEAEIENFQIEKVDMERLTNKICDILAERESDGMLQSELWKKLKLSSRDGSRLSLKLERMGTITREKLLENDRWTYKLILKKTPISTQSIENSPCLVCTVEQKCSIDGEISPKTCQLIEDWVITEFKKPSKAK